jgi:transcription elongation factor GreA
MSEQKRYATCDESLEDMFLAAAEGQDEASGQIASILRFAEPRDSSQWEPEVQEFWQISLELVVEKIDHDQLRPGDCQLLEAILLAGFDSIVIRDRLGAYLKHVFRHYRDPAGLLDAIGVRDSSLPLSAVHLRYQIMQQVKPGAFCYDRQFGLGTIAIVDDIANDVIIQFERRHTVPLRLFMDNFIVVKDLSLVHSLLCGKLAANLLKPSTFEADILSSLIAQAPLDEDLGQRLLVPKVLTEEQYASFASGVSPFAAASASTSTQTTSAATDSNVFSEQWDASRSLLELSERLKNLSTLEVEGEPNLDNVAGILQHAAGRDDQADNFALTLALLQKMAGPLLSWLNEVLARLAEKAVVWQNAETFAAVTDKLPGRMLPFWLRATSTAMGNDYLATQTLQLPARLWTQVEKVLSEASERHLLEEKVTERLKTGKPSADVLFWVWKSGQQQLKDEYLGDAHLLFKTLSQDVSGSYLKAQRDLKRLLLNDEKFQRQVMLDGKHEAVLALIRCTKRMTLLDASERQSLLVKIVRHYPQFIQDVEERRPTAQRRPVGKITSVHSFNQRRQELEELISTLIPENIKAIEEARAMGDLRENSEYKYAKEQQAFLAQRRVELEESLQGMVATDFRDVVVKDAAVPGSTIVLRYHNGSEHQYHLLGLLDSNPELGMISCDAPLGKVLLGCKAQDEIELPSGEKATVVSVSQLPEDILARLA